MPRALLFPIAIIVVFAAGCRREAPQTDQGPAAKTLPYRVTHVLCYHNLTDTPKSDYDVTPQRFQEHLQALKDGGCQTITCKQLADYLAGAQDIPEKSVLISFDDGWKSVLTKAKPLLDQFGYTAVLFINPVSIGGKNYLSWDELKRLVQAGYEIGSHTTTHANLTKKPKSMTMAEFREKVADEIENSYSEIQSQLGTPPVALAYPFGNFDAYVMQTTKSAGYALGLTIERGAIDGQSNPYMLPRKMVVKQTSPKGLQRALDTQPLHLTAPEPPIGERVTSREYSFTAQLLDEDAAGSLQAEGGRGAKLKVDPTTRQLTLTTRLNRGANSVRLLSTGTPRRDMSWIVVVDVAE